MRNAGKICLAVGLAPSCLLIWAASQAQFTFQHPRAPDVKVLVSDKGARLAVNNARATQSNQAHTAIRIPRLTIESRRHDFGYLDPMARGSHSFHLKNNGDAPLTLEVASTTCQCTVAGVSDNQIPPGGEGTVQLSWTVPGHGRVFRQIANVITNDPRNKHLALTVEGCIRTSIGADRDEISVLLDPDKSATTEVVVYSQQWDNFDIRSLESRVSGLKWEQVPASPESLAGLKARSGCTLRLTFTEELSSKVSDSLRLSIQPQSAAGDPVERQDAVGCDLELPLHISVRRRLSIYGPAIREEGLIELGETTQGAARRVKMQIKVRDRDTSLPDLKLETTPGFLHAEITPRMDQKSGKAIEGLYDFVVQIPPDAPACSYLGDVLGQVRIVTSHPRIQETPLAVRFAVLPQQ